MNPDNSDSGRSDVGDEMLERERRIRDNVFRHVLRLGPLRRSLLKTIRQEDFDNEFIDNEQLPLGYVFGTSLDEQVDERPGASYNADTREAVQIALRGLAQQYVCQAGNDIDRAMRKCQSPIEAVMLAALITINAKQNRTLVLDVPGFGWPYSMIHKAGNSPSALRITPRLSLETIPLIFFFICKPFGWSSRKKRQPSCWEVDGSSLIYLRQNTSEHVSALLWNVTVMIFTKKPSCRLPSTNVGMRTPVARLQGLQIYWLRD